jgi:hypothetical protein
MHCLFTSHLNEQMANSIATSRGQAKNHVRVSTRYEFGLIRPARTEEDVEHNLKVFRTLHPNQFHSVVSTNPITFNVAID